MESGEEKPHRRVSRGLGVSDLDHHASAFESEYLDDHVVGRDASALVSVPGVDPALDALEDLLAREQSNRFRAVIDELCHQPKNLTFTQAMSSGTAMKKPESPTSWRVTSAPTSARRGRE
jgi:hypothetical protein